MARRTDIVIVEIAPTFYLHLHFTCDTVCIHSTWLGRINAISIVNALGKKSWKNPMRIWTFQRFADRDTKIRDIDFDLCLIKTGRYNCVSRGIFLLNTGYLNSISLLSLCTSLTRQNWMIRTLPTTKPLVLNKNQVVWKKISKMSFQNFWIGWTILILDNHN